MPFQGQSRFVSPRAPGPPQPSITGTGVAIFQPQDSFPVPNLYFTCSLSLTAPRCNRSQRSTRCRASAPGRFAAPPSFGRSVGQPRTAAIVTTSGRAILGGRRFPKKPLFRPVMGFFTGFFTGFTRAGRAASPPQMKKARNGREAPCATPPCAADSLPGNVATSLWKVLKGTWKRTARTRLAHGSRPPCALAVLAEGTRGCGRGAERPARRPGSAGTPRPALAPSRSRRGEVAFPADSPQHLPLSFPSQRSAGQPSTRRRLRGEQDGPASPPSSGHPRAGAGRRPWRKCGAVRAGVVLAAGSARGGTKGARRRRSGECVGARGGRGALGAPRGAALGPLHRTEGAQMGAARAAAPLTASSGRRGPRGWRAGWRLQLRAELRAGGPAGGRRRVAVELRGVPGEEGPGSGAGLPKGSLRAALGAT